MIFGYNEDKNPHTSKGKTTPQQPFNNCTNNKRKVSGNKLKKRISQHILFSVELTFTAQGRANPQSYCY